MAKLLKTVLAHSDMPPCVIIDGSANIVYVHGRTGRYLEPAEGEVSTNVLEMARPGLRPGELETSKEELQSLNEETVTVNAELQSRIEELVAANDDIRNLLDATDIATIFLDINLNVRRFTPKSTELFHLTAADIGRPIEHFATTLKDARLVEKARTVLNDLGQHESETEDDKGRRYRMRVRPYRTSSNVIAGLVITFENISTYRELVDALTESETLWRGLVENAPMGIFIVTAGRFAYLNPGARQLFGAGSREEMLEMAVLDRVHRDSYTLLSNQLDTLGSEKKPLTAIEVKWLRLDGEPVEMVVSAAPISFRKRDAALFFVREKL